MMRFFCAVAAPVLRGRRGDDSAPAMYLHEGLDLDAAERALVRE